MTARAVIKSLVPPVLVSASRRLRGIAALRFSDCPQNWADACRLSTGYDAGTIVERVGSATREVIAGRAAWERDGALFDEPSPPFEILSGLLKAAVLAGGRLDVVDFGGSLGTLYRRCRPFFDGLESVRWQVVEQTHFVDLGEREFSSPELRFYASPRELPPQTARRVLLLSSVLQYLEDPRAALQSLLTLDPSHVIIDRTPVAEADSDRLCIQHVPRHIYNASYPCWLLSRPKLMASLAHDFRLLDASVSLEGARQTDDGFRFEFQSFLFENKP